MSEVLEDKEELEIIISDDENEAEGQLRLFDNQWHSVIYENKAH